MELGMVFRNKLNLFKTTVVTLITGLMASAAVTSAHAQATSNQDLDTSNSNSCVNAGGALTGSNLFTGANNGSFGTGSGAPDEIPPTDIFAGDFTGGVYEPSFADYDHGDYSYISNLQARRNGGQFLGPHQDPVNGITGRFLVSDPDADAPLFESDVSGLVTGQSYEIGFWVADTEFGNGPKNRIGILLDGDVANPIFETPFLNSNVTANPNILTWEFFTHVYTHTANTTTVSLAVTPLELGAAGRDIFLDEIAVVACSFPANLVTTKTLSAGTSATPEVGDTVSFDITVTNNGDGAATGITLTDTLPAGLTADANNGTTSGTGEANGGSYNAATGEWSTGNLPDGGTATLTLSGTVDAGQEGNTITNTIPGAAVSASVDPTAAGDDLTESVTVVIPPAPSLSMTKVADSEGPFTVGDVITYTYTVTNDGNQAVNDVVVTDTHNGSDPAPVPGNETLSTDAAPTGNSTDAAANGTWDVLAPGDVVTFTGTYTVTADDADTL